MGGWGEQVHLHAKFIRGMLNVGEKFAQRCVKDMHTLKWLTLKATNEQTVVFFLLMAKPNLVCHLQFLIYFFTYITYLAFKQRYNLHKVLIILFQDQRAHLQLNF